MKTADRIGLFFMSNFASLFWLIRYSDDLIYVLTIMLFGFVAGTIFWVVCFFAKFSEVEFLVFSILLGSIGGGLHLYNIPSFECFYSSVFGCFGIWVLRSELLLNEADILLLDEKRYKKKSSSIKLIKKLKLKQDNLKGVVLGSSSKGLFSFEDKQLNRHCLVVGASGIGKTVTIENFIESAILRQIPVVFVDGKGDYDLYCSVRNFAKSCDAKFYGLSGADEDSCSYNPLITGDYTSKKDRIIALREWTEDHYRLLAEGYLQTAFKVLERLDIEIDMANLSRYIDYESLIMIAREIDDDKLMYELLRQESASKQICSLIAEIDNLAKSAAGNLLDTHNGRRVIRLDEAMKDNGIAMFSINKLQFPQFASVLGKLVINDIKALAGDLYKKNGQSKFYIVIDEFSSFAGEQVLNLINMGRGSGAHIILGTQTLADLDAVSESFAGQVLGSISNFIVHGLNNPDDAERMASVFGTRKSAETTWRIDSYGATGDGSLRQTRQFHVHPDDIKNLGVGQAYIYSKTDSISPRFVNIRRSNIR